MSTLPFSNAHICMLLIVTFLHVAGSVKNCRNSWLINTSRLQHLLAQCKQNEVSQAPSPRCPGRLWLGSVHVALSTVPTCIE